MCDVFSRERGESSETGRIAKVGRASQALRVRSLLLWVGVHWCDGPALCAGSICPLCEAGVPKRRKAWVAVDRPNGTFASLELSETDVARFTAACASSGLEFTVGMSLLLRRSGERQPLTVEKVRFYPNLGEVAQDVLMVDVLRFHGVFATKSDVVQQKYRELVVRRAAEVARKVRVPA